jgi:hypothetical protein
MTSETSISTTSISDRIEELERLTLDPNVESPKPKYGPMSDSRLKRCLLNLYYYITKTKQASEVTRFGRDEGTAVHDVFEIDARMRISKPEPKWLPPDRLVMKVVETHPEYISQAETLIEQVTMFRDQFRLNPDNYVGSEEHVGLDFAMRPVDFDSDEAWWRGKIDYTEVASDRIARVVDYKNYPTIHTNEQLGNANKGVAKQLMGYVVAILATHPRLKGATGEIYYSRFGATRRLVRKDEAGEWVPRIITREEAFAWWKKMQRELVAINSLKPEGFIAQPSRTNCQYCPYINDCTFQKERSENEIMATNHLEAEKMLDELIYLEERRKRLKAALNSFSKTQGPVENSEGEWYGYKPKTTSKYPTKEAVQAAVSLVDSEDIDEVINTICRSFTISQPSIAKFVKTIRDEKTLRKLKASCVYTVSTKLGSSF